MREESFSWINLSLTSCFSHLMLTMTWEDLRKTVVAQNVAQVAAQVENGKSLAAANTLDLILNGLE